MVAMLQISVPEEVAEELRARMASGIYRSEADVVREGLRALAAEEERVERWLRTEVVAAYDAHKANPDRVYSIEAVRERLAQRRKRREA